MGLQILCDPVDGKQVVSRDGVDLGLGQIVIQHVNAQRIATSGGISVGVRFGTPEEVIDLVHHLLPGVPGLGNGTLDARRNGHGELKLIGRHAGCRLFQDL
eukprot:NODE_1812_length_542_cov_469.496957_g1467_i0.p3 GENE.NODE_1812_length_542_cov_469.496957_g1467_i0~~NODE_1812_length_542_cov_469.496957_g1467_i0.p3  ORF type:complete len:110 (+),score=30.70 NODE_1812_length_542_cov_469.496957_g1467_i0:29-331(+)